MWGVLRHSGGVVVVCRPVAWCDRVIIASPVGGPDPSLSLFQ